MSKELSGVAVGTRVAIQGPFGRKFRIATVEKVLPSGRLRIAGRLFRDDGHECGMGYERSMARPLTPGIEAEVKRDAAIHECNTIPWHTLAIETLEAVISAVKNGTKETP